MMEPGVILLVLMVLFLLIRMPIAIALALSATLVLVLTNGFIAVQLIGQQMYGISKSWVMLAIPFFMLAGTIMEYGGLTRRIIDFASALVGFLPGGLAAVNVTASMIFGGISGSSSSETSALGAIMIPAMRREGYSGAFASAVTASASCTGMIIPPSIPMVLWSFVSGVSLGNLFLGGVIPGILVGLLQIIICSVISVRRNYGKRQPFSVKLLLSKGKDGFLTLMAPFIIVGGIVSGLVTATEAAVIAVVYSMLLGMLVYKELKFKDLPKILLRSGILSAMVLFIVAGSSLFSYVLTVQGIPGMIAERLLAFGSTPERFILVTVVLFMGLGMIMDVSVIILLVGPIIAPLVMQIGLDPVQTTMIYMVVLALGLVTPPVGLCLFVASGISGISVEAIARESVVFVLGMLVITAVIWYVPATSLWMPQVFGF